MSIEMNGTESDICEGEVVGIRRIMEISIITKQQKILYYSLHLNVYLMLVPLFQFSCFFFSSRLIVQFWLFPLSICQKNNKTSGGNPELQQHSSNDNHAS